MLGLVAVLWAVYLSECLVRWRPGDWVFRRTAFGPVTGVNTPDVTFWNDRLAFVWTSPWPAAIVRRFSGTGMQPLPPLAGHLWLRLSAATLFLLLLVVFPVLALTDRVLPSALPLAAAVLLAWISTFVAFVLTYRRVHGGRPSLELWLTNLLSPVSLARAPQVVALDVAADRHPLIAAAALCADDEFLRIARLFHFDDAALRETIERLAEERGVQRLLLAAPNGAEAGVTRFCRRCHATFKEAAQVCADCQTVELIPLPPH